MCHPGAIIFIDELDAIGTKRFGGEQSGDREVQRLQKVETKEQKTARVRVEMNRVKRT